MCFNVFYYTGTPKGKNKGGNKTATYVAIADLNSAAEDMQAEIEPCKEEAVNKGSLQALFSSTKPTSSSYSTRPKDFAPLQQESVSDQPAAKK